MIKQIIKALQIDDFYGGGKCIEIAKGKNEMVTDLKGLKRKVKRVWLSRR